MQVLQSIQNRIYEIRGERVMLDFDLAILYEVETRVLNQAVKRNAERFPADFMFQLTRKEWQEVQAKSIVNQSFGIPSSQIVMIELPRNRGEKYLPYAFTEQGVSPQPLKGSNALRMNVSN
jgi:hypothetical protein